MSCRTPAGVKSTPAGDGVLYAKSISHMITYPPYSAVDVSPSDVLCHAVDVLVLRTSVSSHRHGPASDTLQHVGCQRSVKKASPQLML